MLKKDLAVALGISGSMVSRLSKQGMPTHSIEAARAWRLHHLDPARVVDQRADMKGPPKTPAPVAKAERAFMAARTALDTGPEFFEAIVPALRTALRAVPEPQRHLVCVDVEVIRVLCAPLIESCQEFDAAHGIDPEAPVTDPDVMTDREVNGVLYGFACGELVLSAPA